MFPSNLHKNIVQLDRQISLLENECKNMEVEKSKKHSRPEQSLSKCSKISNLQLNSPPVKVTLKKSSGFDNSKRNKKINPPFSARVHSTSSLQSSCSKPWSEMGNTVVKKIKQRGVNTNTHVHTCQKIGSSNSQSHCIKKNNCIESVVCNEKSSLGLLKKDIKNCENCSCNLNDIKKDQILHKEVLFSNPGSRIEVTVTQKPHENGENENLLCKKKNLLRNTPESNNLNCHCQSKGPKWSEILCLEPVKRKTENHRHSLNKNISDKTQIIYPLNCCNGSKVLIDEDSFGYHSTERASHIKEHDEDVPIKLVQTSFKLKTPLSNNCIKPEKETQCHFDNSECQKTTTEYNNQDLIQTFQSLINELQQKPNEEKRKLLKDMELLINKLANDEPNHLYKKLLEENKNELLVKSLNLKNDFQYVVKQQFENFTKEKELLSRELSAKDNTIATMQKREEEYLSLISSLKLNLEKTKENAKEGTTALKELSIIKGKFLEQAKVYEALKKSYSRMQEVMERCTLENDKLKTKIQIFKLESQKNDVLLAGKEAEIKRYREEIENFQRQISDHLASLKSNAQTIDVEKMVEAIIQQSQIFGQRDLDSVIFENGEKDSSIKQNNKLMHSSPTSTKTSVVNSSWKQISSIRRNDQTVENSVVLSNLNDSNEEEYFQIFGDDSSSESKTEDTLIKKASDKQEKKKPSSFTSCASINDDDDCSYSSSSKNIISSQKEKSVSDLKVNKFLQFEKAQSNIDELLKNMKLKWSEEVHGASPNFGTIDDFFNNSQISSISVVSENV